MIGLGVLIGIAAFVQILVKFNFPALNAVAALATQALGYVPGDPSKAQLALVACGSSLLAYASARSMMNQDRRNAALYRSTLTQLDDMVQDPNTGLAAAERDIRSGKNQAAMTFFNNARDMLKQDHGAWLARQPSGNVTAGPSHSVEKVLTQS
jgi:hypothetical protein